MKAKIIGNTKALFSIHGEIGVDKALEAIEYMTEAEVINIDEINKASELGLIYITPNGKILDGASKNEEYRAKYKIAPTGLKLRYTEYPLLASFIKMNGFWEGAFIGTGIQLFEMYRDHYAGEREEYCNQFEEVFGGDNRTLDVIGFGLSEVLNNFNNNVIYSDINSTSEDEETDEQYNEIAKALERCRRQIDNEVKANAKFKKSAKYTKAMKKASKLEAHLNRLKGNKEKEVEKEEKQTKKQSELKLCYSSIDEVDWLEILDIHDVHANFEDAATKRFNEQLISNVGCEEEHSDFEDKDAIIKSSNIIEYVEDGTDEDNVEALIKSDETLEEDCKESSESEEIIIEDESDEMDEDILKSMDHDLIEHAKEKDKYKLQLKADLLSDIYERLLIKEDWKVGNKDRLAFYLKGLFILVDSSRKHNKSLTKGNGYTLSKDHSKQLVNTGLINKYGNYIYLVDFTPRVQEFYDKKLILLINKASLLDWGFELSDIRQLPSPVKFVNNNSEYIFRGSINDFDLNDEHHLKHIITERRYRFPAKYKNTSCSDLCDRLKQAIERAVRISKTDYKYIVPKYDFSRNCIQFLVPFHLDTNLDEKAELAIVIGNCNGIWQVYTVLYTDDAYDDARFICKPCSDWLKVNK